MGGQWRYCLRLDVEAMDQIVFGAEEDVAAGRVEAAGDQRAVVFVAQRDVGFCGVDVHWV